MNSNFSVGNRVRKKGESQIMEITYVGNGIVICKWFDWNGYEMADTFDINEIEYVSSGAILIEDSFDCESNKNKGWCGEYCEHARKGKCPEGMKAKFPHNEDDDMNDYNPFLKLEPCVKWVPIRFLIDKNGLRIIEEDDE